jgi:putative hemolysin
VKPKVVGTYRLLRRDVAEKKKGFYTQGEFAIEPLLEAHRDARILELGRSCVHAKYRSKRVIELLWRGLWTYIKHHRIDAMIGCASFPGTDPQAHALPLSFLHHYAMAEAEWQASPKGADQVATNILDKSAFDLRRGLAALPPLLKGYVRVGARFADGAVIDRQFGTIDVFTVMPIAEIEERYIAYYGGSAEETESAAA